MNGQERALVERVFRVGGNVDCFDDVTFLHQFGVDGFGSIDVLGQIQSARSFDGAPKIEAEFVAVGWICHVLESAMLKENFTASQY